jgi:hypothetical protein
MAFDLVRTNTMSSTIATITRADDNGEEVTSEYSPPESVLTKLHKKMLKIFCGYTECTISRGEKISSIADFFTMKK